LWRLQDRHHDARLRFPNVLSNGIPGSLVVIMAFLLVSRRSASVS
jgi:hypothetical protein